MLNAAFQKILDILEYLGRCEKILGRTNTELYLLRYIIFRSKLFSIYIHRFLKSDDDVHHDHPWSFLTLVLKGGYTEEVLVPGWHNLQTGEWTLTSRSVNPLNLILRKSHHIHRIVLKEKSTVISYENRTQGPLTINFIGPRVRTWGFWEKQGFDYQWIYYKNFLHKEFAKKESLNKTFFISVNS